MFTESVATLRAQAHSGLKSAMFSGDFDKAIEIGKQAIEIHGPHVGLLCDLAACYYERGRYSSCWNTVEKLNIEIESCKSLLSKSSLFKTYVFMSKLVEEKGELSRSLDFLKEAEALSESENDLKYVYSQQIRLLSYLGLRKNLSIKYQLLIEKCDDSSHMQIEIGHGLMWAEWRLFGFESAQKRFQELKTLCKTLSDKRLISRDFAEITLIEGSENRTSKLSSVDKDYIFQNLFSDKILSYDRFILASIGNNKPDLVDLINNENMSFMMFFRLSLILMLWHKSELIELRKKVLFLLESLDGVSAHFLRELLPKLEDKSFTINIIDPRNINLEGHELKLTKMQMKLLLLFKNKSQIENTEISEVIWMDSWNEGHYHRLRMLVYKLNDLLRAVTSTEVFDISKTSVKLLTEINFNS